MASPESEEAGPRLSSPDEAGSPAASNGDAVITQRKNPQREMTMRTLNRATSYTGAFPFRQEAVTGPEHEETAKTLWQLYMDANKKKPLLTKSLTTGVLMAIGNVIGQIIMISKKKQKRIDARRILAFIAFGIFVSGPMGHQWLKFLNGRKHGLKGQAAILYKIALDRFGYGPLFNIVQMSFVYKLSGQSWGQVAKNVKNNLWAVQVLNWKMWPFAQFINFNFIPPELQLLYMNCIALCWTTALSLIMQ
mmetsp:Transcript_42930/g.67316  ORF Transcript_42930/g.67316 Transcript_42930/m.67316 type:complete len:249 (+) Transcript_42930:50-796(+)|eukprot:CAMPEP_0184310882 /NCGR_PEP_ID=MMETSP1049-20130417/35710_1 /TAXON_ID=77928 /ORGANISM="Proteomonas sulcata, Strain CCMP704" /LENGTH=248 /DNA_ID=CAMNT_0026625655 /DNA_START=53 /DNA_END=799 /DNA_ORIENTATION=-